MNLPPGKKYIAWLYRAAYFKQSMDKAMFAFLILKGLSGQIILALWVVAFLNKFKFQGASW